MKGVSSSGQWWKSKWQLRRNRTESNIFVAQPEDVHSASCRRVLIPKRDLGTPDFGRPAFIANKDLWTQVFLNPYMCKAECLEVARSQSQYKTISCIVISMNKVSSVECVSISVYWVKGLLCHKLTTDIHKISTGSWGLVVQNHLPWLDLQKIPHAESNQAHVPHTYLFSSISSCQLLNAKHPWASPALHRSIHTIIWTEAASLPSINWAAQDT